MANSDDDYKNINIYTDQDLLNLLDLNINDLNTKDILNKTTFYIEKFTNEDNNDMVVFFKETQNRLLKFYSELKSQSKDWWTNQNLKQDYFYKINNHQSLDLKRQHLKKPKIGKIVMKKPILVN